MGNRIAVLGTGANGASIAADLTRAGEDVVLIDQWPAHVEAMRANGVRIEMPEETVTVPVRAFHLCDVATFDDPFDIVLLVTKAYDTVWPCHLIKHCLTESSLVAGVQNGMTVAAIAEAVGPERTVGCVIEISSQMFEPGVVERHSPPDRSWFAVGAIDPAVKGREEEVRSLLAHSGTAVITRDILSAKWMKLISNATTLATTAVFGVPIAEASAHPAMREIMIRSGTEALVAGQEAGFKLEPIFGLSEDDIRSSNQLVDLLLDKLNANFVLPNTITTVLQDHMKNRRTEAGDINGWVVEERAKQGKSAPVNAAILALCGQIKRGELEAGPENVDRVRRMLGEA